MILRYRPGCANHYSLADRTEHTDIPTIRCGSLASYKHTEHQRVVFRKLAHVANSHPLGTHILSVFGLFPGDAYLLCVRAETSMRKLNSLDLKSDTF
jgi:hypothetical protein